MANRYPLIVDSSSENIKELPAGDGLLFADNDKIVIGRGSLPGAYVDCDVNDTILTITGRAGDVSVRKVSLPVQVLPQVTYR